MRVIYTPAGRAREYALMACNLYTGCANGCRYCYAPACLRKKPAEFHATVTPRANVLDKLRADAQRLRPEDGPVFLCFSCDPYPRDVEPLAAQAVAILAERGVRARLLTKNPSLALRDFDEFRRCDTEFGVSLVWDDDRKRREWEPDADTAQARADAIVSAHIHGIQTWVSVEPVIDPGEAVRVIRALLPYVDGWKIGAWNHDARARDIDYPRFLRWITPYLQETHRAGNAYLIKDDLWAHADDGTRLSLARRVGDADA